MWSSNDPICDSGAALKVYFISTTWDMIVFQQMKASNLLLFIEFTQISRSKLTSRHCGKLSPVHTNLHTHTHTHLRGKLHTQSGTNRPKTLNVHEPAHTPTHTPTPCFEFHLPRKAPKTPLLNSPLQKQSQESNPQSQDLLSFASKCKWKSLFYKRLIERLGEEAVAAHQFSRWMPNGNFIYCRSPRRSRDALISQPCRKVIQGWSRGVWSCSHILFATVTKWILCSLVTRWRRCSQFKVGSDVVLTMLGWRKQIKQNSFPQTWLSND